MLYTFNLLDTAIGAREYLHNLFGDFTSKTKGYADIKTIIKLIEESQELDVSRPGKDQGKEDELDIF